MATGHVIQLGEGNLVGDCIRDHLHEAVIKLRIGITLLGGCGFSDNPDEVLPGLIVASDVGDRVSHLKGVVTWSSCLE